MLQILHIENIAVIEKADIEFAVGMNVLTGETGAGKSMVIDALGAVLGGRTARELIRTGADSATVTAVFTSEAAGQWCKENGIEDENGQLFLMRRMSADGKNTCRVNGSPVSVAQLRELGEMLLNIHGQHDGQHLLSEKFHRDYLDSFAGLSGEIAEYKEKYEVCKKLLNDISSLKMNESEKERGTEALHYQIAELERAGIVPGEWEEKAARRDLLKNAGKLTQALESAFIDMDGGSSEGAVALIGDAEASLRAAARYSDELLKLAEKLENLRFTAEDVTEEIRDLKNSLDFSPDEFDKLEGRLDLLRRLSRKYGNTEEEMLEYLEKSKNELDEMEYSDEKRIKLEAEYEIKRQAALKAASALSEKRKSAAKKLEERIKRELSELSMAGVRFEVNFEKTSSELTETGFDEVAFLMSANAGEEPGRISHIASGGELARIMLAMKNVLAENDNVGVMVFDEVDTGVSGIAAQRVGEKMAVLASKKQIICVTHLPQIAAMADTHFVIEKQERNGKTYTSVTCLDIEGRKRELARLTGGENVTITTLVSASEQLEAAREYKKERSIK